MQYMDMCLVCIMSVCQCSHVPCHESLCQRRAEVRAPRVRFPVWCCVGPGGVLDHCLTCASLMLRLRLSVTGKTVNVKKLGLALPLPMHPLVRACSVVAALYFFICSLSFLSDGFRLVAGRKAGEIFQNSALFDNPLVTMHGLYFLYFCVYWFT